VEARAETVIWAFDHAAHYGTHREVRAPRCPRILAEREGFGSLRSSDVEPVVFARAG
jgi:hypothetical protein